MTNIADIQVTVAEFGVGKVGYARNVDLTDTYTSAKIYVWDDDDSLLIDGATAILTFSDPDSLLTWTPAENALDNATVKTYRAVFELLATGKKSYTLEFVLEVLEGPPAGA